VTTGRWILPKSWEWAKTSEIAQIIGGGTPSTKDEANFLPAGGGFPWIGPADLTKFDAVYISGGRRDLSAKGLKESGATILPLGTVLFTSRAPIGYCAIAENPISTNQGFKSLVCDKRIIPEFIRYYLKSSVPYVDSFASGTTFREVSGKKMAEVLVPLPPLAEQRRIVAKLDSLTARIARARAELKRVPPLIGWHKKNLLEKAFSGALTNKWRLINDISKIKMVPLSDACLTITDGDHQALPRTEHGVPFITISAMNDGEIDLSKATRFVPSSYLDALKDSRKAKSGDVLFSVTGSIGISALVKHECPFVFQRHIAILKPDTERISGLFLKLMLQSPNVQAQCAAVATGTAQLTIPLSGLRNFLIPLPTIAEQIEIIHLIESTFERLQRVHESYIDADRLLSKLESSLLAKAFRGELVPQDPNDEPASVLLDRIRAERAAAPKPKRGRKT
jgi:type I restriction enzyme S subunit